MNTPATYTPPELGERWGIRPESVVALIRSGQLAGFNVALKTDIGKRPRFRITVEAVEDFEARRAVAPKAARSRAVRIDLRKVKQYV